jgi:hypothetical protein
MSEVDPMQDPGEPTEEQIAAFEEQLKRIRVEDVLVQTLVTLVNLGARRLGLTGEPDSRDLDQARMAIEGARALMPLVPDDGLDPVRDALSQLQMAYVREAGGTPPEAGPQPPPAAPAEPGVDPAEAAAKAAEEEERAKARSKLWTPPGS